MVLLKDLIKVLDENAAVAGYISFISENIKKEWDEIKQGLFELSQENNGIKNEKQQIDAFLSAGIALGIRQIINLYPEEQAKRLCGKILSVLDKKLESEVDKYARVYEQASADVKYPVDSVATVLITNLLEGNLTRLQHYKIRKQFLMMYIAEVFSGFSYYWKKIKQEYDLIEL